MHFRLVREFVPKWGHVIISDELGGAAREYMISERELSDVMTSRTCPSCCSDDAWMAGRVKVIGRALLPGEALISPDGALFANFGIKRLTDGQIRLDLRRFPSGEWGLSAGGAALRG